MKVPINVAICPPRCKTGVVFDPPIVGGRIDILRIVLLPVSAT